MSNYEPLEFLKIYEIVSDGKLNEHEFRKIIKRLNIGLSNQEEDKLMDRVEKSREGLIDLKEFIKKTKNE
jgi:Ca2+-binding EF-hand superfamily protein